MTAPYDWTMYDPTIVTKDDQITVDATAGGVALDKNVYSNGWTITTPIGALCTVETAPIRITEDGATAPTSTVGTLYNPGDRFIVWGSKNLLNCKLIRTTGTSATVDIQWLAQR